MLIYQPSPIHIIIIRVRSNSSDSAEIQHLLTEVLSGREDFAFEMLIN